MKSHYILFVISALLFVAACSDKDNDPVKSGNGKKVLLKDISSTEFKRGEFISLHGSGFGDTLKGGCVLFGNVAARIATYNSSYYIGVYTPFNAYDGDLRVVFGKDTSNALPYKIKWKTDDYKLLLKKVVKVIIYAQFYNYREDTLVYELNLNEQYTYETSNFKLSVDTITNAIKIKLPKQGYYYERWGGAPCDSSQKIKHSETWKLYDVPIKDTKELEFIAYRKGDVGTTHVYESGYAPEYHNKTICNTWYYLADNPLPGSITIIFHCK